MTHPTGPLVRGDDRDARLHQRRIDDLVDSASGNVLAGLTSLLFLGAVALWAGDPVAAVGVWLVVTLGQCVWTEVLLGRYRRDPHVLSPQGWEARLTFTSVWAGTVIAAWAWFFAPWDEPIALTMVIAVLVANWVGAAVRQAAGSTSFAALCVGILVGPIAALAVNGGDYRVLGVMALPLGAAIVLLHVDARRQLRQRIQDQEDLALLTAQQAAVFDTIAEAVLTVDRGVVGMCNARFLSLVGRTRAQCVGWPVGDVVPDLAEDASVADGRAIPVTLPATATRSRLYLELRGHAVDGHVDHQVWVCTDITARVQREQQMDVLASRDDLTGFLNRRAFHEQLRGLLDGDDRPEGLMLVDLDGFKAVNDRHGHAVGDVVLARVATRLRDGLSDVVLGRIGGDEFVVVVGSGGRFAVEAVADTVCRLCREPVEVAGAVLEVAASVGVVGLGTDLDLSTALVLADQAMYRAKQAGGDRWVLSPGRSHVDASTPHGPVELPPVPPGPAWGDRQR